MHIDVYIYSEISFSRKKKIASLRQYGWTSGSLLSEINQKEKDEYDLTYMRNLKKYNKKMMKLTDIE